MKQLGLFLVLFIFSACSKNNIEPEPQSFSDWTLIKDKSEPALFYDIYFLDDNFGLISGASGTLLKTADGGENWQTIDLNITSRFYSIFIQDQNTFAVSGNSILLTTDRGDSFTEYLKSENFESITDIVFSDSNTWFVIGNGNMYKSSDKGATWAKVSDFPPQLFRMQFTSSGIAYAFGGVIVNSWTGEGEEEGILAKTIDSGNSWARIQNSDIDSNKLDGMSFINDKTGYIATHWGKIYKTTDGGDNWIFTNDLKITPSDLLFINEYTGYFPSGEKLFKTIDGGKNWAVDLDIDSLETSMVRIINTDNYLYLLNENGSVYKKSIE